MNSPANSVAPLYQRLLGERYAILPAKIRELHDVQERVTFRGRCSARRGKNPLNRLAATILSMPKDGEDIPLTVTFTQQGEQEYWERDFGGHGFNSLQWLHEGKLYERMWPVTLVFEVETDETRLALKLEGMKLLGIPMLTLVRPDVSAIETERDGRFHVDVEVRLPLLGLLVEYHGWLEQESSA